jgi:hypothetical protein
LMVPMMIQSGSAGLSHQLNELTGNDKEAPFEISAAQSFRFLRFIEAGLNSWGCRLLTLQRLEIFGLLQRNRDSTPARHIEPAVVFGFCSLAILTMKRRFDVLEASLLRRGGRVGLRVVRLTIAKPCIGFGAIIPPCHDGLAA